MRLVPVLSPRKVWSLWSHGCDGSWTESGWRSRVSSPKTQEALETLDRCPRRPFTTAWIWIFPKAHINGHFCRFWNSLGSIKLYANGWVAIVLWSLWCPIGDNAIYLFIMFRINVTSCKSDPSTLGVQHDELELKMCSHLQCFIAVLGRIETAWWL